MLQSYSFFVIWHPFLSITAWHCLGMEYSSKRNDECKGYIFFEHPLIPANIACPEMLGHGLVTSVYFRLFIQYITMEFSNKLL